MPPIRHVRQQRSYGFHPHPTHRAETDPSDGDTSDTLEKTVYRSGHRVYFHAPVTRESVALLIKHLDEAQNAAFASGHTHVLLFIHSEGGDAYAGLSAMNHIQYGRMPVTTVADGLVASAGTFLLLGGQRRFAMPHSVVLIHQVSTTFWGKYAELEDELANSQQLMATLRRLYKQKTRLTKTKINSILQKELTMTAKHCLRNGIVHGLFAGDGIK